MLGVDPVSVDRVEVSAGEVEGPIRHVLLGLEGVEVDGRLVRAFLADGGHGSPIGVRV